MFKSRQARYLLKLAIGLSLAALLFARVDFGQLLATLRQYTPAAVFGALALTASSMFVAALRWKVLAPSAPYPRLFKFTLIGQLYSVVLPGQITGDLVKAFRITRGAENGARLAASVLADRVAGLIGLLLVSIAGIVLSHDRLARAVMLPLVGLTAALLLSLILLRVPAVVGFVVAIIRRIEAAAPRARAVCDRLVLLVSGWVEATRSNSSLVWCILLAVVFQLIGVATYVVLASSIGIELDASIWMWIAGVTAVALLLPITIGGIGIREGTLMALLAHYSVPSEKAIALSLGLFSLGLAAAFAGWAAEIAEIRASRSRSD